MGQGTVADCPLRECPCVLLQHTVSTEAAINEELLVILLLYPLLPSWLCTCIKKHLTWGPSLCRTSRWSTDSMTVEECVSPWVHTSCLLLHSSPRKNFFSSLRAEVSMFANIRFCSSPGTADSSGAGQRRAGSWITMSRNTWNLPLTTGMGQSPLGLLINPHEIQNCLMHQNIFGIPLYQLIL